MAASTKLKPGVVIDATAVATPPLSMSSSDLAGVHSITGRCWTPLSARAATYVGGPT